MTEAKQDPIGYIVGGSLKDNLSARLTVEPGTVQEGSFVVIESVPWQFYGLVTDLQLGSTDPRFADEQSESRLTPQLSQLLHGQTLYTNLVILPALMQDSADPQGSPRPVKTVPAHHASVRLAGGSDVAAVFGFPGEQNFIVGHTREQGHPVCLDLDKFVKRSSGVFGATGTGKSFLTRLLLAGLIQWDQTSLLVFDMHNEYGFADISSDTGKSVPGLKTKFGSKVRVVSLGAGTSIRGNTADFNLILAEKDFMPEDIEMLTRELNLRETTPATLNGLFNTFKADRWFTEFRKMTKDTIQDEETGKKIPAPGSVADWAEGAGVNVMAAEALHDKLQRVFHKPYIHENPPINSLKNIIASLEKGEHIGLSFGGFESDLDYLLVTNILTRKIRDAWEVKTNAYRADPTKQEPRPLVVVVEEAHKLLNREMAQQTAFSTIAREMRKYYVTLLIIDQRPSQIYDEVMSQLGTRVSGWLGDEADISAVLSGLAGRDALRGMLSRLEPKEEVVLLGWGVKMPLPIRSRRYDDQFWLDLLGEPKRTPTMDEDFSKLFG